MRRGLKSSFRYMDRILVQFVLHFQKPDSLPAVSSAWLDDEEHVGRLPVLPHVSPFGVHVIYRRTADEDQFPTQIIPCGFLIRAVVRGLVGTVEMNLIRRSVTAAGDGNKYFVETVGALSLPGLESHAPNFYDDANAVVNRFREPW